MMCTHLHPPWRHLDNLRVGAVPALTALTPTSLFRERVEWVQWVQLHEAHSDSNKIAPTPKLKKCSDIDVVANLTRTSGGGSKSKNVPRFLTTKHPGRLHTLFGILKWKN